jgi:hypothetical protein
LGVYRLCFARTPLQGQYKNTVDEVPMSAAATKKTPAKSQALKAVDAVKKSSPTGLSKDKLLSLYREMLLIRRFEEKAGQLYGMGLIGGFCHLYIGQEAVVTAFRPPPRKAMRSSPPTATTHICWPAVWMPKASWPS